MGGGRGRLTTYGAPHTSQPCLEDFITPIRVSIAVSLPHGDPQGPILRPDTPPTWTEVLGEGGESPPWGWDVGPGDPGCPPPQI